MKEKVIDYARIDHGIVKVNCEVMMSLVFLQN